MKKHNIALTYAPKIEAVLDGRCRQTIRRGRKYKVNDFITIIRTPQGFSPQYQLVDVIDVVVDKQKGFLIFEKWYSWDSQTVTKLAEMDYIDPPCGEKLKRVLYGYYPKQDRFEAQIIRW